ncbi:hypothetical protein DY000_02032662 [Brassica cretica]|uniref:Uncharacterized protein n=1 Tax=Brassica cretica TaxID=69181 RepID=A0ABQ7DW62_BRACR|nr:hypothetical protein DY000_02032662 [Brassica cretica]
MKWVRYGLRETSSKGRRECMDLCRIDVSEELGRYVATEQNSVLAHGRGGRSLLTIETSSRLIVGVENGYDEVNVQIPEEKKRKTFFDKHFFEIDSSLRKALRRKRKSSDKSSKRIATQRRNTCSTRSLRSDRVRAKARSLLSDRASIPLGRYAATKLESKLGRYVATELFRNVDATLVHVFSSTLRFYLPKTVANPFHVPRHSKLSIKLYRKNRGKFVLYRKKP